MSKEMTPISVSDIIKENGMGHIEGPFAFVCNGSKPNYRLKDWDGKSGDIVIAQAVEVGSWSTHVYIDGVGYNSACFV